jgi:hypothetical protein
MQLLYPGAEGRMTLRVAPPRAMFQALFRSFTVGKSTGTRSATLM